MRYLLFVCYILSYCSFIFGELQLKPAIITHAGASILTCNTVKCSGGHKCIMTIDECELPFTTHPLTPKNCQSRPKCVPDKLCKACGPNEHRSRCSICDRTCEDPNRKSCKQENICGQTSRCVCDSVFVRDKQGRCVKYLDCPNVSTKGATRSTTAPTTTTEAQPDDGFIVIHKKETKQRHEQIDLLKPSTKNPKGRPEKPQNPKDDPDDGFIVVKEKENKHKPDQSNPLIDPRPTSRPQKPDKPVKNPSKDQLDDGFIIVKDKQHKQTKRPSDNKPNLPVPTKNFNDEFIVVHEKQKNHKNKDDNDFFVAKKKVQNNKHEQVNLM